MPAGGIGQHERLGSFEPFLRQYVGMSTIGYPDAPPSTRSYLSVNLLVEASIKERASTTPLSPKSR
jgi:hypothetical protein